MITIYTDGAARGNPGPGGWGAVIADKEMVREIGGAEEYTTNNRMELTAAIRALEYVTVDDEIEIYTDSEYVLKGITSWVGNWAANNWRTAAKKPVLNQDLWQELLSAQEGKRVKWNLVPGHSGVLANERCDVIATAFADKQDPVLYTGPRSKYEVSLSHVGRL